MERCTNHAYHGDHGGGREINSQPPLKLTVRNIELGEDDRPTPTLDSEEDV